MRLSAIAACTLATLAAGEQINEVGWQAPLPSAAGETEIDPDLDREMTTASARVTAIAQPEQVLDGLSGFATAPAIAAETPKAADTVAIATAPQPQSARSGDWQKPVTTSTPATAHTTPPHHAPLPDFLKLTSAQVVQLQQRLKQEGFDPGAIDGIIGSRTRSAIVAFQRARQLQVDGLIGAETWAVLTAPLPPASVPPANTPPVKGAATTITSSPNPSGNSTRTAAQAQPALTKQSQPAPGPSTPQSPQMGVNVRLAAGFITGFSIPLTMMLLWHMIQLMRLPEQEDASDPDAPLQWNGLLPAEQDLPAPDQLELESHCRAIAEILSKNAVNETVSNFADTDRALRVQFLRAR